MTFIYSRVVDCGDRNVAGAPPCAAHLRFHSAAMPRAGKWIKSDETLPGGDGWPIAAIAAPLRACRAGKPDKTFILQKDPDGAWFIDRWQDDTGGTVRPITGTRPGLWAQSSNDAGTSFIIEIG